MRWVMAKSDAAAGCRLSEEKERTILETLPVEEETQDLAEFFKVFGDPGRLRLLFTLRQGEFCVHDLSRLAGMNQTAVSHQLKTLRQARLVKYRKEGKHVFYSLDDNHIKEILDTGLNHLGD